MSIIAVLIGGMIGTLTALVALFGVGVDWLTGAAVYFGTAALIALPMITVGTTRRARITAGPSLADWQEEFRAIQTEAPLAPLNTSMRENQTRRTKAA